MLGNPTTFLLFTTASQTCQPSSNACVPSFSSADNHGFYFRRQRRHQIETISPKGQPNVQSFLHLCRYGSPAFELWWNVSPPNYLKPTQLHMLCCHSHLLETMHSSLWLLGISSILVTLHGLYALTFLVFISSLPFGLEHQFIHPTDYPTSPPGCLRRMSNLIYTKCVGHSVMPTSLRLHGL